MLIFNVFDSAQKCLTNVMINHCMLYILLFILYRLMFYPVTSVFIFIMLNFVGINVLWVLVANEFSQLIIIFSKPQAYKTECRGHSSVCQVRDWTLFQPVILLTHEKGHVFTQLLDIDFDHFDFNVHPHLQEVAFIGVE